MSAPVRPTALFTSQNLVSIGGIRALHDLGLQHEVAMVGFDDVFLAVTGQTVTARATKNTGTDKKGGKH